MRSLPISLLLAVLLLPITACTASDTAETTVATANPVDESSVAIKPVDTIDFTLPTLQGDAMSLSDHRGQWVVVNYWATWCAPCRKEIPDLSALHSERDDVTVLGLAYEETEPESFETFLEKHHASYPILITDTYNPPEALGAPLALPTTFLVSPDGVIMERFLGPVTREELEEAISSHS